jgi:hypothetical protein
MEGTFCCLSSSSSLILQLDSATVDDLVLLVESYHYLDISSDCSDHLIKPEVVIYIGMTDLLDSFCILTFRQSIEKVG